jgi:hypothetical protein
MLQFVLELCKLSNDGFAFGLNSGIRSLGRRTVDIVNALGLYVISIVDLVRQVVEQATSMTGQRSRAEG